MQTKRVCNALLSCGEDITLMIPDREKERVCKTKAARSRKARDTDIRWRHEVVSTPSFALLLLLYSPSSCYFPFAYLSSFSLFLDVCASTLSDLLLRYHCSLISYSMYNQSGQPNSLFTGDSKRYQRFNQKQKNVCLKIDKHLNCNRNKVRVNYNIIL